MAMIEALLDNFWLKIQAWNWLWPYLLCFLVGLNIGMVWMRRLIRKPVEASQREMAILAVQLQEQIEVFEGLIAKVTKGSDD